VAGRVYREWPPPPELRRPVFCLWADERPSDSPGTGLVLPDACMDLVWDGREVSVAGPDTGPVTVERPPRAAFVGLRFRPGQAPPVLGLPSDALRDQRVGLAELWDGDEVDRLTERLAAAPTAEEAAAHLAAAVQRRRRMAGADEADPLVGGLVAWLGTAPASAGVVATAAEALGVGVRQLHRRCEDGVGYGPKMLERVLRFRRAQQLVERGAGLAAAAAGAGYADQPHMNRDFRRLTGRSPAELLLSGPPVSEPAVSDPFKTGPGPGS